MRKTALLLCLALLVAQTTALGSARSFKEGWAEIGPTKTIGGCSAIMGTRDDRCIAHVIAGFEPICLRKDCDIALEVNVDKRGVPSSTIVENTGSEEELFYAEQAVWDGAPFDSYGQDMKFRFVFPHYNPNSDHDNLNHYLQAHPSMEDAVVLQVIPTQAQRRSINEFGIREMHTTNNLVTISVRNLKSRLLSDFRREWVNFLIANPRADRTSIIDEGAYLLEKYSLLFQT